MRVKLLLFSVLVCPLIFSTVGRCEDRVFLNSNNAKMYQALQLIDDRTQWLHVSELLREILSSDISDPFVLKQLKLAKKEVDAGVVQKQTQTRVVDHPFVVAKLRITEAMMGNRTKLNISYDREVALIKGLLQSYFFPGHENEGEILFPDVSSYAFDIYGYVKENVEKTETAPSGVIEDPRFPSQDDEMNTKGFTSGRKNFMSPDDVQNNLTFIRQIIESFGEVIGAARDEMDQLFDVVRCQNQYEPYAMLLQIIANPDSVYADPQLNDFLKGVKLRVKVGEYEFKPDQQNILKEVLKDQSDVGLKLQERISSTTGRVTLYALSNLAGPDMLHLRYLIYLKKFIEFHPETTAKYVPAMLDFSRWLKGLGAASAWYQKMFFVPLNVSGTLVLGSQRIVTTVLENGSVVKLLSRVQNSWIAKNDRYFKIALVVTMACDLAEGTFRYMAAMDKYDRLDAVQTTLAKEVATMLYILPMVSQRAVYQYLGMTVFALDVGHLINPSVPATYQVIKGVFADYIPNKLSKWIYGYTLRDAMIADYEGQIGIDERDSSRLLDTFADAVQQSTDSAQLTVSEEAFGQTMKDYANKRLFIIYYFIQRWNNNAVTELGEMEKRYLSDYELYQNKVDSLKQQLEAKKTLLSAQ